MLYELCRKTSQTADGTPVALLGESDLLDGQVPAQLLDARWPMDPAT